MQPAVQSLWNRHFGKSTVVDIEVLLAKVTACRNEGTASAEDQRLVSHVRDLYRSIVDLEYLLQRNAVGLPLPVQNQVSGSSVRGHILGDCFTTTLKRLA